jgi:hypothetical protein
VALRDGEEPEIPSREGLDEDYYYDVFGGSWHKIFPFRFSICYIYLQSSQKKKKKTVISK